MTIRREVEFVMQPGYSQAKQVASSVSKRPVHHEEHAVVEAGLGDSKVQSKRKKTTSDDYRRSSSQRRPQRGSMSISGSTAHNIGKDIEARFVAFPESAARAEKVPLKIEPLLSRGDKDLVSHTATPCVMIDSLALKSNYKHIREGTRISGVTFSPELYNELASRRSSNKAAEQSRRDGINCAINELGGLLPLQIGLDDADPMLEAEDGFAGRPRNSNPRNPRNSKVAILKAAIMYIKQLQEEAVDKERLLRTRTQEMHCIKRGQQG